MTLVLLILALIWAVVLIPPVLRNRAEGRPSDSIAAFRRQLAVLDRAAPRGPGDPDERSYHSGRGTAMSAAAVMAARSQATRRPALPPPSIRRRRRDVLVALLAAAGSTLVVGAVPAFRFVWALHVVVDVLLVAYVALLIRQRNIAAERQLKVRFLPGPRPVDDRSWSPRSERAWLAN